MCYYLLHYRFSAFSKQGGDAFLFGTGNITVPDSEKITIMVSIMLNKSQSSVFILIWVLVLDLCSHVCDKVSKFLNVVSHITLKYFNNWNNIQLMIFIKFNSIQFNSILYFSYNKTQIVQYQCKYIATIWVVEITKI